MNIKRLLQVKLQILYIDLLSIEQLINKINHGQDSPPLTGTSEIDVMVNQVVKWTKEVTK